MRPTNFSYTRNPGRGRTVRPDGAGILGAVVIALAMLAALVLPTVTRPSAALLLTGIAAVFALGASGSLVNLVITDVRKRVAQSRDRAALTQPGAASTRS